MTSPAAVAAAMRQQAESGQASHRQLVGGLMIRYWQGDGKQILTLTRQHPGPSPAEREQWRAAFKVNSTAFEYKAAEGEYISVSVEW